MKRLALLLLLAAPSTYAACTGSSPTWTTTPDSASVQTCINSATAGDTINISAGSATWTGANAVVVAKAVTLNGAGQGVTVITLAGGVSQIVHFTKQTGGPTRVQNLSFSVSSNKSTPHSIVVDGPWPTGQPVVFNHITVNLSSADFMTAVTPGGVIIANSTVHGTIVGDTLFTGKSPTDSASWAAADSLGTHDSTGWMNHYIETNLGDQGANFTDCDDSCRIVMRYNTGHDGATFNSHGADTSPVGMREFEIYNNTLTLPDKSCPGGLVTNPSNINQWIWIRGATGVIYNNQMEPLVTSCWGTKTNVKLAIRNAEDDRLGLTCAQVAYPTLHQLGQNFNGTSLFQDPIWFWGNTTTDATRMPNGLFISVSNGWMFGNPCGFNWNTFFQWGRDGQNTSLTLPIVNPSGGGNQEGQGGTPKPGYTAFAYPHPLVGGSSPQLSFSPASVNFGTVTVGSNVSQTVTTTNAGNANEVLSTPHFTLAGSATVTRTGGTCADGATITSGGGSCTDIVKFTPAATGTVNATLTINGTVSGSVPLTGIGGSSASPPSTPTNFAVGVSGPNITLTWTASLGTPTITYNCQQATVSTGPFTTFTTTATTSCVSSGNSAGTYYLRVSATNSAGTSAPTSALSATVIALTPSAQLAPSALGFPSAGIGVATSTGCSQSSTCTVVLTNTGTATLNITSISIAGPNAADFSKTTTCGGTLAVSASCNIPVTFTPSITGLETASLVLVSNDPTSPDSVSLSGTGFQAVTVAPVSLSFGNQFLRKTSAAQSVTINNNSAGTLTFTSAPALTTGTVFVISSTTCGATVLAAASCSVSITFTPTSIGNQTDTLTFAFTGPGGSPITVPIGGNGKKHGVLRVGAAVNWPYNGAEIIKTVLRPWNKEEWLEDLLDTI